MSNWTFTAVRVVVAEWRQPPNLAALLLLPVLAAVGLLGNALVCIAIATDRRLHNVTNYFLFSLALADLFVCCLVMPLSIIVEVKHGEGIVARLARLLLAPQFSRARRRSSPLLPTYVFGVLLLALRIARDFLCKGKSL